MENNIVDLLKNKEIYFDNVSKFINIKLGVDLPFDKIIDLMSTNGYEHCQNCQVFQPSFKMVEESDGYCENCC
jgi:hypothetical protein